MYETRHELPLTQRTRAVEILNQGLADVLDLYTQTKNAHWNVKGPNFYQLHLLFDNMADDVFPYIDKLGERITALGGRVEGTLHQAAQTSRVKEFDADNTKEMQVVEALASRYAKLSGELRKASIEADDELHDPATQDLINGLILTLDEKLYFLESHLQHLPVRSIPF